MIINGDMRNHGAPSATKITNTNYSSKATLSICRFWQIWQRKPTFPSFYENSKPTSARLIWNSFKLQFTASVESLTRSRRYGDFEL